MISINKEDISEKPPNNDSEIVLSVNGVSKKFCRDLKRSLFYGVKDIASEVLGLREKSENLRSKEFWALQDVSFQLRRGESIGLVGKNGSGKSTLLRIIAGLIKPDTGLVEINGRVAPLIALGAGFNPILTGRENIYANMSILGLSKKEIDERFDAVVEFAEVGDAIDSPVQTYSSGMAARLGFACAIHTEPEILLIDEVLAVGDSRFKGKCFRKLHELRQNNTSFILVSHESHTVLTVCESAVYLNKGKKLGFGNAPSVIKQYEEDLFSVKTENGSKSVTLLSKPQLESSGFEITSVHFRDAQGEKVEFPTSGKSTDLCIKCKVDRETNNVGITVLIKGLAEGGNLVLLLNCLHDNQPLNFLPGEYEVKISMPYLGLKMGSYIMDIYAKENGFNHLDVVENFGFKVQSIESIHKGLFYQPRTWIIDKQ